MARIWRVGSGQGEANCVTSLGTIAFERPDYVEALRRYEEGLRLFRQVGNVEGEANCAARLGDVALRRCDYIEARRLYEEALTLFKQVASVHGEANCIESLAEIALGRQDYGEARRRYDEALPPFRQVGRVQGEATCIVGLGDVENRLAQQDAAKTHYGKALVSTNKFPNRTPLGELTSASPVSPPQAKSVITTSKLLAPLGSASIVRTLSKNSTMSSSPPADIPRTRRSQAG
jgi:tetratricopeptide (TPR) repeat protein